MLPVRLSLGRISPGCIGGISQPAAIRTVTMATPTINVEVYSDLACPYCYIGKDRLEKAAAALSGTAEVKPTWRAFLLDSNYASTHPVGEPLMVALQNKFGANAAALQQRVMTYGRPDASFKDWQWRANTFPGHRLVALARQHGKSHEANAALFERAYERGENISDVAVLADAAREIGLPENVEEYLAGEGGVDDVLQDDLKAKRELRVTGVPAFFIRSGASKTYVVSGAQPVEMFLEAFRKALAEGGTNAAEAE